MGKPNKVVTITRDGVTIDGHSVAALDQPIEIEHLADDLHIVHLSIYAESIESGDPQVDSSTTTTYELRNDPMGAAPEITKAVTS